MFFGSRDLSHIFLGLKKIRVFFWVLPPSELFVSGFRCDLVDQKNIHSNFYSATCAPEKLLILRRQYNVHLESGFWVGNFNARYFFGSKISGLCIFLGLQYEAPSVAFDSPPTFKLSCQDPRAHFVRR